GRGLSLGMIAAVAGSAMIGLGDMHGGEMQLYGDLLALAGALFAATYLMLGRKVRQKIATFPYIFLVYGISSLFLFALCLQQGVDLITYSGKNWLLFALLALIPTLIGHTSFNWALSEVKASRVGATILGEPIGASILAAIIFDEIPNPLSMAGGLLVLSAIYYIWKKRKPKTLDS
ncbi:MAG: DMT family transporter, partial [Candidatus Acetothermia bacterium]